MTLPFGYEFAGDSFFKDLANFITPPKAGKVTAVEVSGQVRVDTDDPDGGDVLAWPLNGFTYAVDDVVYVLFAVNNPESAIVIGSKGTIPELNVAALPEAYVPVDGSDPLTGDWDIGEDRAIELEALQARDIEGISLKSDEGTERLKVGDDGVISVYSIIQALTSAGMILKNDGGDAVLTVRDDGYAQVLSRLGVGVTPTVGFHLLTNDSGAAVLIDASGTAYNATGGLARFIDDNDREIVIGGLGMFRRDVDADNGDLRFNFLGYNGGATRYRDYKIYDGKGNLVMIVDGSSGFIGIKGEDAPEGQLHGDGFMWVKKTGIVGTKQVIIANGSGDVTKILTGFYTLSDGSSGVSNAISMTPAPSTDAIAVGGSTWTLTLATNGEFSVIRTAGTGTATMTFMLTWI